MLPTCSQCLLEWLTISFEKVPKTGKSKEGMRQSVSYRAFRPEVIQGARGRLQQVGNRSILCPNTIIHSARSKMSLSTGLLDWFQKDEYLTVDWIGKFTWAEKSSRGDME